MTEFMDYPKDKKYEEFLKFTIESFKIIRRAAKILVNILMSSDFI